MKAAVDNAASAAAHQRERFGWLRLWVVDMVFVAEILDC
jgi:hypothetical protein